MIDWGTATRGAAALAERPEIASGALAAAAARAGRCQNTAFPLSPLPVYAAAAPARAVVPALERYVGLLRRIVEVFRAEPAVRAWYGLGPAAEALVAADPRDDVPVCRLDGYLEQGTERLWLLENNADAPAGTLFTPRVNRIAAETLADAGSPCPQWSDLTFTDEAALLGAVCADPRVGRDPAVAVLALAGAVSAEVEEMVEVFRSAGAHAFVADPRAAKVRAGRAYFDGEPADACWNKVNTAGWRAVVESDPDLVRTWSEAVSGGNLAAANPFGARYAAESKFALALPRDPGFADLFTEEERAVADLVPWSVRVDERTPTPEGNGSLVAELLENPADYVIKQAYDIRGDGVTVGRAAKRSVWRAAVERAVRERLLVQRYVPPAAYPVVRLADKPVVAAMPISFDTYVLGGKVVGFGSKASFHARLNVFRGGRKLAVHVLR
ncbi:hypothetical protein V5P93_006243 [Actinokineospora auranticolor]|uniref:Circularly permuted ATP-grasp superfamily protein n=1 Tax=Actinokineospora auranticolor TaxID=155976 RepID=A0A2S6GI13_9PSEU|nr:hypothetical protein [Actinokineospora auranticolor]PPK64840.1 hypothetical protein CLV40_11779 [Actinokineospora auranticolor]